MSLPPDTLQIDARAALEPLKDHGRAASVGYYVALHDAAPLKAYGPKYSLTHLDSIAIPVTYVCVGLLMSLPQAYIEYFPRTRSATDAQLSTVLVVRSLPWSIKVLFGILPDNFPLRGLRFKPYMMLGYLTSSIFNAFIAFFGSSLTVVSFTLLLLGSMAGIVLADVMSDALVASRVLRKQEMSPGHVQSTVYMCRYLSEMVGYWAGALLSNRDVWGVGFTMSEVFWLLALLPLFTAVPAIYTLQEPAAPVAVASWSLQREQLWIMVQRRATWQPLCFLALFNALLLHNSAWGNYLTVAYAFDAFQYGAMAAVAATVTFCSIYLYRNWIMPRFESPWQGVYLFTGVIMSLFSILNVLLVLRVNEALGIPPFWFSLGDAAVISFARGFQQLPIAIMFVSVCPENQEGVAYALLTSIHNLSHSVGHTLSNMLLRIWPVELPDLHAGHTDGVWKLTVLTSLISLLPLLVVRKLLPKGKKEQDAMRDDLSASGARLAIALYVFGFVWVVALSLLAIFSPCNELVGGHGC